MGTNCAPLFADLFLFCYVRDLMMSLSDDKQADIIDAFNTTNLIMFCSRSACVVVNRITVGNFTFLFNCTPVGLTSEFLTVQLKILFY